MNGKKYRIDYNEVRYTGKANGKEDSIFFSYSVSFSFFVAIITIIPKDNNVSIKHERFTQLLCMKTRRRVIK